MVLVSADDILNLVNQMRPNELDEMALLFWLAHIEHSVTQELFDGDDSYTKFGYMTLGFPYNDVYWTYMISMIDLALGNLFCQELGEILDAPRAQAICRGFDRGIAAEDLCRRCGFARDRFQ